MHHLLVAHIIYLEERGREERRGGEKRGKEWSGEERRVLTKDSSKHWRYTDLMDGLLVE